MERKLKNFFRKVSTRRKADRQTQRTKQKPTPPSTDPEQTPGRNVLHVGQDLESFPPIDLNSEPLRRSVQQEHESLSQYTKQNIESPWRSSEARPGLSYLPHEATSFQTMTPQQAGRTESQAGNVESYTSRDSSPEIASNRQSEVMADSIAHDYAAYQSMPSPTTVPNRPQHITLGDDTRLMTDESMLRHNEDIADRNIVANSSEHGSSLHSLTDNEDKLLTHLRKGPIGKQSVGNNSTGKGSIRSTGINDQHSPSLESSSVKSQYSNRQSWPVRVAREELHWGKRKGTGDGNNVSQASSSRDFAPQQRMDRKSDVGSMDLRAAIVDGGKNDRDDRQADDRLASALKERLFIKGVDLDDSVDVDQSTCWAPAVTHEVIKPTAHHIREEKIHREIHNYEVYHRIQPVYETEVLPTRHFVPDPKSNSMIEVSEDQLPDCTGVNQRWFIGENKINTRASPYSHTRLTKPKIADEKPYMTPEGFERRETTIMHSPTLEDLSQYGGPVRTVHFPGTPEEKKAHFNARPDAVPFTLKDLSGSQPNSPIPIPEQLVPPRSSSVRT
ncbi:hypothetical protein K505DRAFT_358299 [Melanomma pulvis-pyrius CBS 109.77]|uniref:Uncharacterized protein n=1 Tax=Melanomma pulvis-pyrius CBS 109.77 TaxID=1314802 RepID=A0A6A6XM55_9PLEO|nr:hypothetical protein K505DRAFT_358299 [Melanomma pulvis-pyrius CBS 109.77]